MITIKDKYIKLDFHEDAALRFAQMARNDLAA